MWGNPDDEHNTLLQMAEPSRESVVGKLPGWNRYKELHKEAEDG